MKYIDSYDSYNESTKNPITQITNTLNNLLSTLGLKCFYHPSFKHYPSFKHFEINLNLGEIKNSIISNIINSMLDTNNCEYGIYPTFPDYNDNYGVEKCISILINDEFGWDADSQNFLNRTILASSNEDIYKKILLEIISVFENAKPEYNINAKNGIFPKALEKNIFDLNSINILIIKYLKILASKRYSKSNYNYKDLYKLAYEAICNLDNSFKIFNNIYNNNLKLFNSLKEFGKINIEIGKDMGELGF